MDKILFVIGLPRSGTTLLQRILSSSAQIETTSEPWLFLNFLNYRDRRNHKSIHGSRQTAIAIGEFMGDDSSLDTHIARALRNYLEERYPDSRYFCEKTPRNLLYFTRLRAWFPNERFLIINRNPLNVAASIFRTFERGSLCLYKFKVDLELGLKNLIEANRMADDALAIRYEDLISDPLQTLTKCSEYLNLVPPLNPDQAPIKIEGTMGDPTGQHSFTGIQDQSEFAYTSFINSIYRKQWYMNFIKSIGKDGFRILGYDYAAHEKAIKDIRVWKPISLKDLKCLVGRRFLEFLTFRIIPRRTEEIPDYILQ